MKNLKKIIQDKSTIVDMSVLIISTIVKAIKWGDRLYRVAIHGPAAKDKPYPHIHIYDSKDIFPYKNFNFEISLVDILCDDEINLVCQQDRENHIDRRKRDLCDWTGYYKLRDSFEDWLYDTPSKPGEYIDNLHVIIHDYNEESPYGSENPLFDYIHNQGKVVMEKHMRYFET